MGDAAWQRLVSPVGRRSAGVSLRLCSAEWRLSAVSTRVNRYLAGVDLRDELEELGVLELGVAVLL